MKPNPIYANELVAAILTAWPGSEITIEGKPPMQELTDNEIAAVEAASPIAGAFLEGIGKTDLATLEEGEWMQFLATAIGAYADHMSKLHAPYAVLRSSDDPIEGGYQQPERPTGPITESEIPY